MFRGGYKCCDPNWYRVSSDAPGCHPPERARFDMQRLLGNKPCNHTNEMCSFRKSLSCQQHRRRGRGPHTCFYRCSNSSIFGTDAIAYYQLVVFRLCSWSLHYFHYLSTLADIMYLQGTSRTWAKKVSLLIFVITLSTVSQFSYFLAHIHARKLATEWCIVGPPNSVCVTALPCKIFQILYLTVTVNCNCYYRPTSGGYLS